jgi:hypothetical protein
MGTIAAGMDANCYASASHRGADRRGGRPGSASTFAGRNCSAGAV